MAMACLIALSLLLTLIQQTCGTSTVPDPPIGSLPTTPSRPKPSASTPALTEKSIKHHIHGVELALTTPRLRQTQKPSLSPSPVRRLIHINGRNLTHTPALYPVIHTPKQEATHIPYPRQSHSHIITVGTSSANDDWRLAGSADEPLTTSIGSAVSMTVNQKPTNTQPPGRGAAEVTLVANGPKISTVQPRNALPSAANHQLPDSQTTQSMPRSTAKGLEKVETASQSTAGPRLSAAKTQKTPPVTTVSIWGAKLNTTTAQPKTGQTTQPTDTSSQKFGRKLFPQEELKNNLSILSERAPPLIPATSTLPSSSDRVPIAPNRTLLEWEDLQRTLAFAWQLHVYGSAGIFLLLAVGAMLGLVLSPSRRCPNRVCLALANGLLLLAATLRAVHFFLDPYGSRQILPHVAVCLLYNLPLVLLLWALAALALLSVLTAGLALRPRRPALLAVLATLHCTTVLACDLLSPALSPAVPVLLQILSLAWGLLLCVCFLAYALPRLQHLPAPPLGEPAGGLGVMGRVLAACACLGTICCGLHVHATLWLYGLLGHWRSFSWAWWLVQFWARLLELAWTSFMLLLASWVFWRQRGQEEGGVASEQPSSSSSLSSSQRHPCWAKIVQSLSGRSCAKSDSGGSSGSGSGVTSTELPNNWAGQERPGADISKSLIRNRGVKESNHGRNQKGGSTGSLLRLQSHRESQEHHKESILTLNDLRPPSPIDLSRSIDEALHREHLLHSGVYFRPVSPPSSPPTHRLLPLGSWPRRSSDPQINLADSCSVHKNSQPPPEGRQTTVALTPGHLSYDKDSSSTGIPSSVSCPGSFRPAGEDSREMVMLDSEAQPGSRNLGQGVSWGLVEDSASVSSDIIDL